MTDIDHSILFAASPITTGPEKGYYDARGKRVLDLIVILALTPILLPLVALLAALLSADGHSPFFGHARVGRNGTVFRCWKFRTMVPDAEKTLARILASDPQAAREWKENQKLEHDPRITRIGRFLRATSLDELPQFWNILVGDMTLVGPRPVTRDELPRYGAAADTVFALRPGLTGLWQISGRNRIGYEDRVKLDLRYARSLNFFADAVILLKTAKVVVQRTGT